MKVRREIDTKLEQLIKKIQRNEKMKGKKCTFPKASQILAMKIRGIVK